MKRRCFRAEALWSVRGVRKEDIGQLLVHRLNAIAAREPQSAQFFAQRPVIELKARKMLGRCLADLLLKRDDHVPDQVRQPLGSARQHLI